MDTYGVVVLKNVLPISAVQRANAAHNALIADVQDDIDDLQTVAFGDKTRRNQSFYKGGERNIDGLRIRTTAKGRVDLKSLDRCVARKLPNFSLLSLTTRLAYC
jgi:hypothetical protein